MAIRMQQRRGTSEQWTLANPILAPGEVGFETDNSQFKIGDGVNRWEDLAYFVNADGISGALGDYIPLSEKGEADGIATLDSEGQVPAEQLGNATVDLSDYATEGFVTDAIADIPPVDLTGYATEEYVGSAVSDLVASAPETLDTLNELAAALGDDENFATTVTNAIAAKADAEHTHDLADLTDFDVEEPEENQVLKFDGTAWINAAAGGGIQASEEPPTDTEAFPLWYNTTEGRSYIYYDNFWVELTPSIAGADGAPGADGADGADGVAIAEYPLEYDSETKTISLDEQGIGAIQDNYILTLMSAI
jgi:hypothetical protein